MPSTTWAPTVPAASDDVVVLADYIELRALRSDDLNASAQDLVSVLVRSGTAEALVDTEEELEDEERLPLNADDRCEELGDAAFGELEDRNRSCGNAYPFQVLTNAIQGDTGSFSSIYTFLLALSQVGPKKLAGQMPERLFEDLARLAALHYLGGAAAGADAVHFGFPRRVLPRDFPSALKSLCLALGDASENGAKPAARDQKDGKLDLVAWRNFPDNRPGKLVAFGQCAAGLTDWRRKVTELDARAFQKKWLLHHLSVDPVRMFFLPLRVPSSAMRDLCIDAGIVFDRCRIAAFASSADAKLVKGCTAWTKAALAGCR